jgi:phosphate-selective porin OprO/OprP
MKTGTAKADKSKRAKQIAMTHLFFGLVIAFPKSLGRRQRLPRTRRRSRRRGYGSAGVWRQNNCDAINIYALVASADKEIAVITRSMLDVILAPVSAKEVPRGHVSVPYHGYWLWIDGRDSPSKRTFLFSMLDFILTETRGKQRAPFVAIPGGRKHGAAKHGYSMPRQQTLANLCILLFCLALLGVCVFLFFDGMALGEEGEAASQSDEGRVWIPRVAFPSSHPTEKAGYVPLLDRNLSVEYLKYSFYLSLAKGLEVTRKDSDFYLRIGGRIYLDFVHYFQDLNYLGPDGFGLRNFQIDADGRFTEKWTYRLSVGGMTNGGKFNGGGAYLDYAYAAYVGEKNAWIFGQQDEPFSLDQMTSSLATTFMERALPTALTPGKNIGIGFRTARSPFSISAGLFGGNIASAKDGGEQGIGFTGRIVFQPEIAAENRVVHLGASVSYRGIPPSDDIYYRYRPESGLTDVRYVNTGDIYEVNQLKLLGLEAAFASGPLSFQAEYITAFADRNTGYDNLRFYGWYAFVSWFPTGESRKYFPEEAIFAYPEIRRKWGALELAARYSMLHLNSGSIPGGQETNVTLGINWYINRRFRLMAEYLFVLCDQNANDNGTVIGGDQPQIFQMRLQMRF